MSLPSVERDPEVRVELDAAPSEQLHADLSEIVGFYGIVEEGDKTYALFRRAMDTTDLAAVIAVTLSAVPEMRTDPPAAVIEPDYPAEYAAAKTVDEKLEVVARRLGLQTDSPNIDPVLP